MTASSPPAWYHGVWPPNSLAATVRDGWFNILGDLTGFPYNAVIVQGGTVDLILTGTIPPAGSIISVDLTDPNGKLIVSGLQFPYAGEDMVLLLNATMNVTLQYTLTVTLVFPNVAAGGSPPSIAADIDIQGSALYSGYTLTINVPPYATSYLERFRILNTDGTAAVGATVQVQTRDNIDPGVYGSIAGGSAVTDAEGSVTFQGTSFFALDDTYTADVLVLQGGTTVGAQSFTFTGGSLANGVNKQISLGGAAKGSANAFAVSVNVDGVQESGVSVGAGLVDPSTKATVWTGTLITGATGVVTFPVSTSLSGYSSLTLTASVSKELGSGPGKHPYITGTATKPVSPAQIAAGSIVLVVNATVEE